MPGWRPSAGLYKGNGYTIMKLKFIIPGDRIVLKETLKVNEDVGFNRLGSFRGVTELPKGTVLSVI